jgi:hypothetical protein
MNLIDNVFTAEQDISLLRNLIMDVIHFHETEIYSKSKLDKGQGVHHLMRLEELFQLRDELNQELDFIQKTGLLLKVQCEIRYSVVSGQVIENQPQ